MAGEAVAKTAEVPELDASTVILPTDHPGPGGDIVVNEAGEEIQPASQAEASSGAEAGSPGEEDDERLVASQASAEEAGKTDAEREVIRARRREEKARKRENFQALKRDLHARDVAINELRGEIDVLKRKSTGGEIAQIDAALKQTEETYKFYKNRIAEATSTADGVAVAEATEKMIQAREKHSQLSAIKEGYSRRQNTPAPLDPRVLSHAQEWMTRNSWYDPGSNDEESALLRTIDNRVAGEGFDPKTPEYWAELTRRAAKYLPERFTNPGNRGINQGKPRTTVGGSGRESGSASGGNGGQAGFVLSAERVAAIKDAGAWDDPARRAAMIKRFREYDRNQGSR